MTDAAARLEARRLMLNVRDALDEHAARLALDGDGAVDEAVLVMGSALRALAKAADALGVRISLN